MTRVIRVVTIRDFHQDGEASLESLSYVLYHNMTVVPFILNLHLSSPSSPITYFNFFLKEEYHALNISN